MQSSKNATESADPLNGSSKVHLTIRLYLALPYLSSMGSSHLQTVLGLAVLKLDVQALLDANLHLQGRGKTWLSSGMD